MKIIFRAIPGLNKREKYFFCKFVSVLKCLLHYFLYNYQGYPIYHHVLQYYTQ